MIVVISQVRDKEERRADNRRKLAFQVGPDPTLANHDESNDQKHRARSVQKRAAAKEMAASNPPLLDAKGRAVPPDVRSMVNQMKQKRS